MMIEGLDISEDKILFVSDIETFTKKIREDLLNKVKLRNYKLVVLIGDILSGLSTEDPTYKIFEQSYEVFNMFYDFKKILKSHKKGNVTDWDIARLYVGKEVSERLDEKYGKEIKSFRSFVGSCNILKIPVIFYSGNHDSLLSWSHTFDNRFIPILEGLSNLEGLKIPYDFEEIKLNKNLYLTGIHTPIDQIEEYEFFQIKDIVKTLNDKIKEPSKTIFVSHIPGKRKFSKLGSGDINLLKKRFKFKYHYHGHCKDYHAEYLEEGIPTRPVHYDEEADKEIIKEEEVKKSVKKRCCD